MQDQKPIFGNRLPDNREIEVPFFEHGAGFGLKFWLEHHQHALLGFRQHHLISGHVHFTLRHVFEVQLDAQATLVAHFHGRTGQARGPHVLD